MYLSHFCIQMTRNNFLLQKAKTIALMGFHRNLKTYLVKFFFSYDD